VECFSKRDSLIGMTLPVMHPRSRKRLESGERRARVLAAALRSFARSGYDGTSMDDIAAAAGITKPVLYDHFKSKQMLFTAVLEAIRDELLSRGLSVLSQPVSLEEGLRGSIRAFFSFAAENPHSIHVLLQVPKTHRVAAAISKNIQAGASSSIASMMQASWPKAEPWRLLAAAEFIKGGLHALAERAIDKPKVSVDQLVHVVMDLMWTGLASSDQLGRRAGRS
jgi:AcrR family transcriptional regulator